MNIFKGTGMVGSGNMYTEVVSNNSTRSYKLGTMCHYFCLRYEGVT